MVCFFNPLLSQEECGYFEIISVYDFPPSPQTPGGNFILLLLTVTENLPSTFDPNYTDLWFIDQDENLITIPTGLSQTLPHQISDTIPYILELNTELNNQDFPSNFDGKLIIETINAPPFPNPTVCTINYSNIVSNTNSIFEFDKIVKVYPNPFSNWIRIDTHKPLKQITVFDKLGRQIYSSTNYSQQSIINLNMKVPNEILVVIQFQDGSVFTQKVLKVR